MLPADTLKLIQDTAAKAANNPIVTCDREPAHVYYTRDPDGGLTRAVADQPPANTRVCDLATLAHIAAVSGEAEILDAWYTRKAVVLVADRDRHTLAFEPSPQFAALIQWSANTAGVSFTQADLIRLLRTTLADCYPSDPQFLANVRKLATSRAAKVNSEIQKGKVSLGKDIVAEMSGVDLIPDEVKFRVPVFAAAALWVTADVRVCVEPDPEKERFTLTVIPGQVEHAWAKGEEWVAAKLRGELAEAGATAVPVYFGSP